MPQKLNKSDIGDPVPMFNPEEVGEQQEDLTQSTEMLVD